MCGLSSGSEDSAAEEEGPEGAPFEASVGQVLQLALLQMGQATATASQVADELMRLRQLLLQPAASGGGLSLSGAAAHPVLPGWQHVVALTSVPGGGGAEAPVELVRQQVQAALAACCGTTVARCGPGGDDAWMALPCLSHRAQEHRTALSLALRSLPAMLAASEHVRALLRGAGAPGNS